MVADPWAPEHDGRDHEFWIEQEQLMTEAIDQLRETVACMSDRLRRLRGMRGGVKVRVYQSGPGSHYNWERQRAA
jgi:hypothetical protein